MILENKLKEFSSGKKQLFYICYELVDVFSETGVESLVVYIEKTDSVGEYKYEIYIKTKD
ncbi:MAG: hypothetical protein KatS3mg001_481 [Candidatus Pacearchaeota archaeon]|nr:MAG: hypothetical protein KatS3mg001_481 [Candidatus Pacearchaeota archaeon]